MRDMKLAMALAGSVLTFAAAAGAQAQTAPAAATYHPTVDDWVGVNDAVDNYTLGLEQHDMARFDRAFWPEATIIAEPEPGKSFTMPYRAAAMPPPSAGGAPGGPPGSPPPGFPPPGGPGGPGAPGAPAGPGAAPAGMPRVNAIGNGNPPWHLSLSHHFEFQSATRATHYGYFVSVYPDLATKITTVGLPGHYEDVLEKRNGEWRILQRKTVIGAK